LKLSRIGVVVRLELSRIGVGGVPATTAERVWCVKPTPHHAIFVWCVKPTPHHTIFVWCVKPTPHHTIFVWCVKPTPHHTIFVWCGLRAATRVGGTCAAFY
jgi:hypothetical protein